jgi:hypothetical protein
LVVVSDQRHVARDRKTQLHDRVVRADGHPVAAAEQRGRRIVTGQQIASMPVTTVRLVGAVPDKLRFVADPGLPQCLAVPLEALLGSVGRAKTVDEADPAVAGFEQDLGGGAASFLLGRYDGDVVGPGCVAVQENRLRLLQASRWRDLTGVHRTEDDAVHLTAENHVDGRLLHRGIPAGVQHRDEVIAFPRVLRSATDRVTGERCGGDLVGDEAQRLRPLRAQSAGSMVRLVTERPDRLGDPITSGRGDARGARIVVDHHRDRGRRYSSQLGHLSHRGPRGLLWRHASSSRRDLVKGFSERTPVSSAGQEICPLIDWQMSSS